MQAGVYCRSDPHGRLEASVAVVRGRAIVDHVTVDSASSVRTPQSFDDLRAATQDLFTRHQPDLVVLWQLGPVVSGIPGGIRAASDGIRAEGAVLCAAAALSLEVAVIERDALLDASGERRRSDALAYFVRQLREPPTSETVACAAAAALASADLRP